MREVSTQIIIDAVKDSAIKANFELGDDVVQAFKDGIEKEESPVGKDILNQLLENSEIARNERIPMCQDTGLAIIFAEIGQEVSIVGGDFNAVPHTDGGDSPASPIMLGAGFTDAFRSLHPDVQQNPGATHRNGRRIDQLYYKGAGLRNTSTPSGCRTT